jgi:hypothetical protein
MIYPVTMYSGKCDNCGYKIELGGGEYFAYGEDDTVREEMASSDWHIDEGKKGEPEKHYCPDCWSWGDDDELLIKESRKNLHK